MDSLPRQLLTEALDHNDDWTGLSSPAARRKLQNKLNQRARRWRQAPNKTTPLKSRIIDVQKGHQVVHSPHYQFTNPAAEDKNVEATEITLPRRYVKDLRFPLSGDHLIHLIQLNVYRALLTNMMSLGMSHIFSCATTLDEKDTRIISAVPLPATVPPLLEPTALQRQTPHSAWIDLFPLPSLRDALIRIQGLFDEGELYVDIFGSIGSKGSGEEHASHYKHLQKSLGSNRERTGVVVWGDPWCVNSWEIEEGFARKWGWMLRTDSEELLESTNRWRRSRGEKPIDWARMGFSVKKN